MLEDFVISSRSSVCRSVVGLWPDSHMLDAECSFRLYEEPAWIELKQILGSQVQQPGRVVSGCMKQELQCRGFVYAICRDLQRLGLCVYMIMARKQAWMHSEKRHAS